MLLKMSEEPDDYEGPWPEGDAMTEWVMVPVEPTEAMFSASRSQEWDTFEQEWRAMLDAAPAAPLASAAAVEAELLDIFISEAGEVLIFIDQSLAQARQQAASQDQLAMLRRSFHTLKGSARMVALDQFAEAAASIERVIVTRGIAPRFIEAVAQAAMILRHGPEHGMGAREKTHLVEVLGQHRGRVGVVRDVQHQRRLTSAPLCKQ